ncbi:MAG: hypothetical protein WCH61_01770 [bacterium]
MPQHNHHLTWGIIYRRQTVNGGIGIPGDRRYIACLMALLGYGAFLYIHLVAFKKAFGCGTRWSSEMHFTGTRFVCLRVSDRDKDGGS